MMHRSRASQGSTTTATRIFRRLALGVAFFLALKTSAHAITADEAQKMVDTAEKAGATDPAQGARLYLGIIPYRSPELLSVDLMRVGVFLVSPKLELPSSTGEQYLRRGIALAERIDQWCWTSYGWRQLAQGLMDRDDVDLDHVAEVLDRADEFALGCDPGSQDFGESSRHAYARGLVELLRADLYRLEGDQPSQLYALDQALTLLPPDTSYALNTRFRLLELRHDLGDVTDDGAGYDSLLAIPAVNEDSNTQLRHNLHISRAALALDQGQPQDAVPHLEAVLKDSLDAPEDESFVSMAYAYLCLVALRQQQPDLATWRLKDMKSFAHLVALDRQRGLMAYVEGEYLLAQGDTSSARAFFQAVLPAGETEPELQWRALEGLSRVALKEGNPGEARGWLVQAIDGIEQQRRLMAADFWVLAYTSQRRQLYDGLLELLVDAWQPPPEASTASPVAPSVASPERSPRNFTGTTDDLLSLVEKRSALSLTAALMADRGGLSEAARRSLTLANRQLTGEWSSGPALRSQLNSNQTFYVYQPLRDRILILEVRRENATGYVVPFGTDRQQMLKQVLTVLRGQPTGTPAELDQLGEWLLRPILNDLPGPETPTAFVLLGDLESLPLSALRIEGRYLVERTAPYEAPALLVPGLLPPPWVSSPLPALGIAGATDLRWAEPQLELLDRPGVSMHLLENPATVDAVLASLQQPVGLIVFATHGTPPRRSQRVPATGTSFQMLARQEAALVLKDGILTPSRLSGLNLKGAWVVLSACDSRTGDRRFQEHSQGSLHRAFLTAGASSVLGTRWKISDRATYALMALLFEELFPMDRDDARRRDARSRPGMALALAHAQRRLLRGQLESLPEAVRMKLDASVAESSVPLSAPWSWAAFSLVGRPD